MQIVVLVLVDWAGVRPNLGPGAVPSRKMVGCVNGSHLWFRSIFGSRVPFRISLPQQTFCDMALLRFFVFPALAVLAGPLRFTRIGPPQTELVDYAISAFDSLQNHQVAPALQNRPPDIEALIDKAVRYNGLAMDRNTIADGNCGPDAILRNLERLALSNERSRQALSTLQRKGRAIQRINPSALRASTFPPRFWLGRFPVRITEWSIVIRAPDAYRRVGAPFPAPQKFGHCPQTSFCSRSGLRAGSRPMPLI